VGIVARKGGFYPDASPQEKHPVAGPHFVRPQLQALGVLVTSTNNQTVIDECELLLKTDHHDHEDLIRSIQLSEDAYAVPYLEKAVLLKPSLTYLDYDDYGAYYKKCFWALKAIGTTEAIQVIESFSKSTDSVINEQALYRLNKIRNNRS